MNETANTNQQGIAEDPALSSGRTVERAEALDKAQCARAAAGELSRFTSVRRNELLLAATDTPITSTKEILVADAEDTEADKARGFNSSLLNRLRLDAARVEGIADRLHQVAALPDSIGKMLCGSALPNGTKLSQVSVPLGVMGMVYEARPDVTIDAFGLVLESGDVALLHGFKSVVHSNTQLVMVLREVLTNHNAPEDLIQLLPCETHDSVRDLITACGLVNVVIPRGGTGLIEAVVTKTAVPTIETGIGNCHIYIDASTDINEAIVLMTNGKAYRLSVYNATETVLIDSTLSVQGQACILDALADTDIAVHGDADNLVASGWTGEAVPAAAKDRSDEYFSLDIATHIVGGVVAVTNHITEYSSGYTETTFVCDQGVCQKFANRADVVAVSANASIAFTGGEQYGFGVEIGISTQKLHARRPMGLPELAGSKWVPADHGQVRP